MANDDLPAADFLKYGRIGPFTCQHIAVHCASQVEFVDSVRRGARSQAGKADGRRKARRLFGGSFQGIARGAILPRRLIA